MGHLFLVGPKNGEIPVTRAGTVFGPYDISVSEMNLAGIAWGGFILAAENKKPRSRTGAKPAHQDDAEPEEETVAALA